MSKQMGLPPSAIYRITDELTAWSFDRAVITFGISLQNEIRKIQDKAKKKADAERKITMLMDRWLSSADGDAVPKGRFADPMARA